MEQQQYLKYNEQQLATLAQSKAWYAYFGFPSYRLNHGSFGAAPKKVLRHQRRERKEWERQPDRDYLRDIPSKISLQRKRLAPLLHLPSPHQIILTENITTAIALVLQSLHDKTVHQILSTSSLNNSSSSSSSSSSSPPVCLIFSTSYFAVKQAARAILSPVGYEIVESPVPFPVQHENDLLLAFQSTLIKLKAQHRRIALLILDHISSVPAIIFPIQKMIPLARSFSVEQIMIDGAHAFGQVPIDLSTLDVDYYSSNLHKWGLAPTSVAFLYLRNPSDPSLRHPIPSHSSTEGLVRESMWTGTRDTSAILSVSAALDFIDEIGGLENLAARNHAVLVDAARMLTLAWKTSPCTPESLMGSMANIALPEALVFQDKNVTPTAFRDLLREDYFIEVVVFAIPPHGYLRVSCQIYNSFDHYQVLKEAVLDIIAKEKFTGVALKELQDKTAPTLSDPEIAPPGPLISSSFTPSKL